VLQEQNKIEEFWQIHLSEQEQGGSGSSHEKESTGTFGVEADSVSNENHSGSANSFA
jgi:hypothetical protein